MTADPIRLLIADDHPVVRQGLRTFLATWPDFEVAGEAGDGEAAVAEAAIARELFVAEKTVKTHVSSILAKLRLADRTQAALYAARLGLPSS